MYIHVCRRIKAFTYVCVHMRVHVKKHWDVLHSFLCISICEEVWMFWDLRLSVLIWLSYISIYKCIFFFLHSSFFVWFGLVFPDFETTFRIWYSFSYTNKYEKGNQKEIWLLISVFCETFENNGFYA